MKRLLTLATLLAWLVVVAPAGAFHLPTTGEQISMFYVNAPTTFPADTPFFVRHGNVTDERVPGGGTKADCLNPLTRFELIVDGTPVHTALDLEIDTKNGVCTKLHLANFRFGLPAGSHTFVAKWYDQSGTLFLTRTNVIEFTRTNLALGKAASASSEYPGNPAALAVDGNWWTYWGSGGFPPAWLDVDLGAVESVREIDLGITQLPDCATTHRLYGRAATSDPYTLLHEFSGFTVDQQVLTYVAPAAHELRFVRVETTSSCSWVGWREVEVYR